MQEIGGLVGRSLFFKIEKTACDCPEKQLKLRHFATTFQLHELHGDGGIAINM